MAHISSLGASIYTYLDMVTSVPGTYANAAAYAAEFVGSTPGTADTADGQVTGVANHVRLPSIREFPSVGTPANIVNVPVFGQAISSQVQGQADAPSLEVTVNYVAADMLDFHSLIGKQCVFRVMMADSPVTQDEGAAATLTQGNTQFFFTGKIEAILVNPALTDATTATVTISTQTDFFGPHTI